MTTCKAQVDATFSGYDLRCVEPVGHDGYVHTTKTGRKFSVDDTPGNRKVTVQLDDERV